MKKVIIDTNFLLIPAKYKIDIFTELDKLIHHPYELYIFRGSVDELKDIQNKQKGRHRDYAKIALQLIEGRVNIIEKKGYVDDLIVKEADENTFVATADKELKEKVKKKGGEVIVLKQKSFLKFEDK